MTIFTDTPVRRSALSEFQAPLGDVLGATAEEALLFSPWSSANRSGEIIKAEEGEPIMFGIGGRETPATSMLRPEDARQRVRDAGVELVIPEEGIRGGALDILIERKREEQRRQDVLSRAPDGFAAGAARIGVGLGASLLDPLNIAAAFIPVVGEARYAKLVANASGAAERMGVRAGVGALEGTVGAALMEPIIYHAATQEQADYDISDSLINIAFGTALGGGLHVGVGAAADAVGLGSASYNGNRIGKSATVTTDLPQLLEQVDFKTRETALRTGVAQALSGREIDVEALLPNIGSRSDPINIDTEISARSEKGANLHDSENVSPARQISRRQENLPPAGKLQEAALKSFAPGTLRLADVDGASRADRFVLPQRKLLERSDDASGTASDLGKVEIGTAEALEDAQRAADAIGAPETVRTEIAPYETLIDSAAAYGRAIVAAANCQLRRGA